MPGVSGAFASARQVTVSGALLVAGTSSDAGKSLVVAGLCRMLAGRGVRVAPFKAQNMSNNSAVTIEGGEIGRAQAVQARAAGLEPSNRFNPILLKPGGDYTSQLVIRGQVADSVTAAGYFAHRTDLARIVFDELSSLRAEFDAVICEGAGSLAEINLRATDLANLGLARSANLPVVVVGDIDRGGLLAHLFGSVAVLDPEDQALVAGFIVNKFRGDPALLAPGLRQLFDLTGRPTYGVLPYAEQLWADAEDSLSVLAHHVVGVPAAPRGTECLRIAAVRFPRISNSTDIEALACEPGVWVRWVTDPAELVDADVIVLPGSKATVADLTWLHERGLAELIVAHARAGKPLLGICGGFQMLCRRIEDAIESRVGEVAGLGLLDIDIAFMENKVLRRWPFPLSGYEIHHGRIVRCNQAGWFAVAAQPQGFLRDKVFGTHWHGLLDNDDFRRGWLTEVAEAAGRSGFVVAQDINVVERRDAQLQLMADLLAAHLDVDAVVGLLDGNPPRRPYLVSGLRWP
ncbi:MAG: cobyric acid synthase [Mycobacteriaceae bacterium]|nr:cobyric acid synthase [Mycobacteriaceae bacterium]